MAFIITMTKTELYPATHSLNKLRIGSNKTPRGVGVPPSSAGVTQPTHTSVLPIRKMETESIPSLGKATNQMNFSPYL